MRFLRRFPIQQKEKKIKSTVNKKKRRSKHLHRIFFVNHLVHIELKTVHLKIAHVLGILEEGDGGGGGGNLGSKSCQHI